VTTTRRRRRRRRRKKKKEEEMKKRRRKRMTTSRYSLPDSDHGLFWLANSIVLLVEGWQTNLVSPGWGYSFF
jgi:hypothetical protein